MGCLLPFLPLHMLAVGLTAQEIGTISMIAPLVSILGPIIAGPLADRAAAARLLASQGAEDKASSPKNGRYLRVMIAVCCVFSALFYSLLLLVPAVGRIDLPHELRPAVRFSCDDRGAVVHQERSSLFLSSK
jgi:MFS family permease